MVYLKHSKYCRELIQNQTAMLHLIILKMFGLLDLFKGMFGLMRLVFRTVPFAFDKDAKLYNRMRQEQVIMVQL